MTKNQEFETTIREQQWRLKELLGANVTQLGLLAGLDKL